VSTFGVSLQGDRPSVRALDALSNRIIDCAFAVAITLGSLFPERVYRNAVQDAIVVELKTVRTLDGVHRAQ
jgi:hypothetical protein